MMDFSVDRENNRILVKREFAAKLPMVWDAYTKSEILDTWWAPKPWTAKTKSMDFREGGSWHYAMVGPEGEEHWAIAIYRKIDPKNSFVVDDAFADADGNINRDMPQSHWDVRFTDRGEVTLVENDLSFENLEHLETIIQMGFKEGLLAAMENLDSLLEAHR